MLIDIASLPEGDADAEVLIVGAGAVGLSLGIALARRGVRVMILEAGGERPAVDYRRFNAGTVVGRPHRGLTEGRMRALGGTTRLWGGQLVPFDPADFAGDAASGRPAWPVTFEDINPWFAAAFEFLKVDPAAADEAAVWHDVTGQPQEFGEALRLGMSIWLPQADFTRLFADDIAHLPGLTIVTNAPVERLCFDLAGGRVIAVEVAGVAPRTIAAPTVVLAHGTLEIARLLLRTAATTSSCGFSDNAALGRGFIDHLHGLGGSIEVKNPGGLRDLFDNVYRHGRKYGVKMRASQQLRRSRDIVNCAASIYTPVSIGTAVRDLATLMRRLLRGGGTGGLRTGIADAARMAAILAPIAWRYLVARRSTSMFSRGVWLGIEVEQLPTARSFIALDPAEPPETAPIVLHWQLDGREIDAIAAVCEAVAAQFAARGLGRVTIDPRVVARDPAFLDDCIDAYHQMGGACMGEKAGDAVVDRDLRVFGTDNLFVLGAATFPSGSFANPTLTAIAFSLRLADYLARQMSRSC